MNDLPELQTLDDAETGIYTIGKSLSLPEPPALGWDWVGVPLINLSANIMESYVIVQYENGDNYYFVRAVGGEWKYLSAIKADGKNPRVFKMFSDMWHEVDKSREVDPDIRWQVEQILKEKGLSYEIQRT